MLGILASMSSAVTSIGAGFSSIGAVASKIWEAVKTAFQDYVIDPIEDFFEWFEGAWDDLSTWADEAFDFVMTEFLTKDYWTGPDGVLTNIYDMFPDWDELFSFVPEGFLTRAYWTGEGGVFDWTIDWDHLFYWVPEGIFTKDYWTGPDGVLTFDIKWGEIFSFVPEGFLTKAYWTGEGGVFDWTIDWGHLFYWVPEGIFTKAYWSTDGGLLDIDWPSWGEIFSFVPEGIFTAEYWETTFTDISDTTLALMTAMGEGMETILKAPFNALIELVNYIFSEISFSKTITNPLTGTDYTFGMDLTSWKIPLLAKGGIVNKPTLAMIGEDGPEAVVPLNQRNNPGGAGMGGTVNVTVNAGGITDRTDKRALAREIGNMIQNELARNIGGTTMRGR